MKDIKKIIHFNLTKEISLKMNRPTKSKHWDFFAKRPLKLDEIWRSIFSMIFKKSYLEGVLNFCIRTPNANKTGIEVGGSNKFLCVKARYLPVKIFIFLPVKKKFTPVKKFLAVSVKNPDCPWKMSKMRAWKWFWTREKNGKKCQKWLSRTLLVFTGEKNSTGLKGVVVGSFLRYLVQIWQGQIPKKWA